MISVKGRQTINFSFLVTFGMSTLLCAFIFCHRSASQFRPCSSYPGNFPSSQAAMGNVHRLLLLILFTGIIGCSGAVDGQLVCSNFLLQFGDSLSDTGNAVLAFPQQAFQGRSPPYGSAFPGFPVGRYSNGRLVVDWLAGAFKLQMAEPYLRSFVPSVENRVPPVANTGNYRDGVCFSVALATAESISELNKGGAYITIAMPIPLNPFSLDVQFQWFRFFKELVFASASTPGGILQNLPDPKVLATALYVVGEIGYNDYLVKLISGQTVQQVKAAVPAVIQKIVRLVEKLHGEGARRFLVIGLTPQGCSPSFLTQFNGTKDNLKCLKRYNKIDHLHESKLRIAVHELRKKLADSTVIFADYYGAYISIIKIAAQYGIEVTDRACCGGGGPFNFNLTAPCGTPSATVCPNPEQYVYWDDTHFTDSFNRIVAHKFISGEYLDPPGTSLGCP